TAADHVGGAGAQAARGEEEDEFTSADGGGAAPLKDEATREQTLKALKKLTSSCSSPRHHRKPPTAIPASDVLAGKRPPGSVYHFLLWDEGMSPFDNDKAIKELAPKEVEALKKWHKGRTAPYSQDEIAHLGKLS